jgi:hypothetical protein
MGRVDVYRGFWWVDLKEKIPLGRFRRRCVDNNKRDVKEIGSDGVDWINVARDRDWWRALLNEGMNFRVSKIRVIFGISEDMLASQVLCCVELIGWMVGLLVAEYIFLSCNVQIKHLGLSSVPSLEESSDFLLEFVLPRGGILVKLLAVARNTVNRRTLQRTHIK